MNAKFILAAATLASVSASAQTMQTTFHGDTAIVTITNPTKYIVLPVEEKRPEAQVQLASGSPTDTWMDIRLAQTKTDYRVPFALTAPSTGKGGKIQYKTRLS